MLFFLVMAFGIISTHESGQDKAGQDTSPLAIPNPSGALICHKSKGFIVKIAQWLMARVQKWD